MIEEADGEAAVEELMGKEVTPETAPVKAAAPEEALVMHVLPCLEELVWASLQEIHKLCVKNGF